MLAHALAVVQLCLAGKSQHHGSQSCCSHLHCLRNAACLVTLAMALALEVAFAVLASQLLVGALLQAMQEACLRESRQRLQTIRSQSQAGQKGRGAEEESARPVAARTPSTRCLVGAQGDLHRESKPLG